MRSIGQGLEYKVYDQGSGRVLKVRRSLCGRLFASFRYVVRARSIANWLGIVRILLPKVNTLPRLVTRLRTMSPETRKLFANIEIANGCDYTQDRVTSLRDYIASHSLEESLAVVAGYVKLIKSLWSVGAGDPYYNFLWNAGVYADGSVAQIDVADLVTEVDIISESVRRRPWLTTAIPAIGDERLRQECARLLDAHLTHDAFLRSWPRPTSGDPHRDILGEDPEARGKKRYFK
jgi:hypothetical protein